MCKYGQRLLQIHLDDASEDAHDEWYDNVLRRALFYDVLKEQHGYTHIQ